MNKKDYVKSAKAGDILNETALKDFKDQSNNRKSILKEYDGINYKIETIGTISDMKYKNSFEETVLDFIKEQKEFNKRQEEFNKQQIEFNRRQEEFNSFVFEFIKDQKEFNKQVITRLDNIEIRLDAVEQDIKDIKACPTIQKEISIIK